MNLLYVSGIKVTLGIFLLKIKCITSSNVPHVRFLKNHFPKHPTQKPLELIEHLLLISSNPSDIVFDPFMGVGTTGEAALKNNRRFIGTDINEGYVKASLKRLSMY